MIDLKIGEILIARGAVREADVTRALSYQNAYGGRIGTALVRLGAVSEDDLLSALADQLDIGIATRVQLDRADISPSASSVKRGISARWWSEQQAAVIADGQGGLVCAATDPMDPNLREIVIRLFGPNVPFALAKQVDMEAVTARIVSETTEPADVLEIDDQGSVEALKELAEQAPIIDYLNRVFTEAIESRASDIHIEPGESQFEVRMRIDGVLIRKQVSARRLFDPLATRIKLLSGMDIAERRLPQDGRQSIRLSGQDVDLRVSTLPVMHGESIVMRLLRKKQEIPGLNALGMEAETLGRLEQVLKSPNGVVLVTGPTGSGKTTTLYRGLDMLRDGERKIITAEDPVEYEVPGVMQMQVKADIGLTFGLGLRAILRQDPNIVLVGEIRDGETAAICVQSALTGHIVLSTLHTNSAAEAVSRLVDLGVEPYLVAATVRGMLAQRLVRRLCDQCSVPSSDGDVQAAEALLSRHDAYDDSLPANWRSPVGCSACSSTGYSGRLGIFDLIVVDEAVRGAIIERAPGTAIEALSVRAGSQPMILDGLLKARRGTTTVSEILRVAGDPTAAQINA